MKFEKINSSKFSIFEKATIPNLNRILGGYVDTSRPATNEHDIATTTGCDNVKTTKNGSSSSSDTQAD
jgi:hypothetical protein